MALEIHGDFQEELNAGKLPQSLSSSLAQSAPELDFSLPEVVKGDWPSTPKTVDRWVVRDNDSDAQFAIVSEKGKDIYAIRRWSNWYEHPESYWLASRAERKSEVDRGQSDQLLYAFHCLFGHHGVFSLTPVWILAFAGMAVLLFNNRLKLRLFAVMTIVLTVVVISFYVIHRPPMDRNYGGVTSALRWLFWLAPLWLVCMLPVVEWLGKTRNGRFVCIALLILSGLSAAWSMNNPWVHPWLYEIWHLTGLPK